MHPSIGRLKIIIERKSKIDFRVQICMKYSSSNYYAKRIRKIDSMKIFFQSSNEIVISERKGKKIVYRFLYTGILYRDYSLENMERER